MRHKSPTRSLSLFQNDSSAQGFSLIEAIVALIMLLAALGGLVPAFLNYRLSIINNQRQALSIAVAKRELDKLRKLTISDFPSPNASTTQPITNLPGGNPEYTGQLIFCPDSSTDTQLAGRCSDQTRAVRVEILYRNKEIFNIETVFTSLE